MVVVTNGVWSFDNDKKTATYKASTESTEAILTISGFGSDLSSTFTTDNSKPVVDSNGNIKLTDTYLTGLANNGTLTLGGSGANDYQLQLDAAIASKPKIGKDTAFTVTATSSDPGNATLKGKLTAYYEVSQGGETITFHDAAADTTLATITGLTSVDSIAFDSDTKTSIQLKLANLSNSKTGVSISPVTIANLDTSASNIDPANFKFTFVANGTSGDDGNTVNTTNETLGFTSDGNTFKTVAGDNKAVTYNAKTMEGWTLSTDGKSITYTAADDTKVLATITGLGYDVDTANVGASSVKVKPNTGSAEGITVSGSVITINKAALGSTTVTLNNETGSSYTLAFKTDETITTDNNYKGKVGFDNYDTSTKYWQATDGTATYKYTIGEGWTLAADSKSITHTPEATTELITLTGLKVDDITNNTTTAITGVNFGDTGASTSNDTSTIYISSSVFDKTTEGSVVSLTKSGTVGSNTYSKLALDASESTLKTALTVNTTPDLKLSTTITGSNATITGDTFEWYEIPTGDSPTTITYHKAKDDTAFATITGLAATASTDNVSFDKTTKTLTLDAAALGTNTITLTTTTGISGLGSGDGNIDFKLALGDLGTTKAAAANTVDTNDNTKSITVASGTATINGKTLPYYTVESGDKFIIYSPAQTGQTLATISGLSSDANTSNVTFKMDGTTQTGTIVLGKAALGKVEDTNMILSTSDVKNVGALNLKLAFDESDSTYNATNKTLGFEDSGDYWTVNSGKATYQHNTKEGWTILRDGARVGYTAAENPVEWLSLDNLKTTSGSEGTLVTGETEKYSSLNGITIDRNGGTLVISSDLLQADASKTVTLPTDYDVQIKEGTTGTAGKSVGFGTHEDSPYWRVNGTTAYLQYDTDGGWKVENGKITYTVKKTGTTGTVLATITGLKNDSNSLTSGLTEKTSGTSCYDTLNGITFNKTTGVITIDGTALTTTADAKATLTMGDGVAAGTYKLALASGVSDITGVENTIGFNLNGTTATVLEKRAAGYVLGDSDTTLTYKADVNNTLATITELAGGVKYQTGDSDATLPKALYVDATGGNFTEVVTLDTTNKTVTLKEDALSKTSGDTGTVKISEANSEYTLAIDGATNNKLGFDNEDGTTKSWHHVDVVASDTTLASTTAKYQYTVGEGWTLVDGKTITYKAATTADGTDTTAPTVLVTITGLKASLTDTDLAAIGAPTLDSTTGFYTVTLPTDVLPEAAALEVASSENNYILAIDGANTDGEYGFGNSGGYWELAKVTEDGSYKDTITATYKCDYYSGWKVEDGKIKYTAETTKELAKIEGLNGGFMTIEAGKKYPTIAGITVDGDTFKLKQDVLGTSASAPVKVTKLTGADSSTSYKLAFADETNTDGSLGFVDSTPTWSIDGSTNTTAHYTYKTGQGWKLNSTTGNIEYTAETAEKTRATVTGLKNDGSLLANIKAGGITVSTNSPSAEQPGVLTLKKSVLNETNSQAVTVLKDDYTLAVDAGNTITSTEHTTALNYDAAASGKVTVKETLGAGWLSSNNDKTLTYYSAVDKELATITGLKAGVTASDFDFNAKTISVAASALTNWDVTIAKGSGETELTLQYTLALKDSTVTYDNKNAFGFGNIDGAEKYWAVNGTTVTYQHNVGAGWYLDGTNIKYVRPQQPTPEGEDADNYSDPVVDAKLSGLKSGLTVSGGAIAGITLGADKKTITVTKDVLTNGDLKLTKANGTDFSNIEYTLALGGDDGTGIDATSGDNKLGFKDSDPYWVITGSDGNYTAKYMYDTAEGWTISGNTINYTNLVSKEVLTITGLKTATGTALTDSAGDPVAGSYSTLTGVTVDGNTVKLADSVLGSNAITLTKVSDTTNLSDTYKNVTYSLGLAGDTDNDGKVGFTAGDNKWKVDSGTTAVYYHDIGEGWTLVLGPNLASITYTKASDGNTTTIGDQSTIVTVAQIANLKSEISATTDGEIAGLTADDEAKTITVSKSVLNTDTSKIATLTKNGSGTSDYTLALDSTDTTYNATNKTIGFEDSDPYFAVSTGTAASKAFYQYDTTEGYTLNDAGTTITYAAAKTASGTDANTKATVLATISGLKTDLTASNGVISGIDVSENADGSTTFTVTSMDVFTGTTGNVTLAPGEGVADGDYKLALDSSLATEAVVNTVNNSTAYNSTDKVIEIKGSTNAYVKLTNDAQIAYTAAATNQVLATIEGLKDSDVSSSVTISDNTITIAKDALKDTYSAGKVIELKSKGITDTPSFVLDLVSGDGSTAINQVANKLTGNLSLGDVANGTAAITQGTEAYYTVSLDGQSVSYTGAKSGVTVAEVTGLASTASTSNVTFNSNVIMLGKAAFGTGTIALVNKKINGSSDHGLSLAFPTSTDDFHVSDNKAGFKEAPNGKWVVKSGVATYTLETGAGWTLDPNTNVITYTAAVTNELVNVKGLKGLKDGTYDSITGVDITTTGTSPITTTFAIAESLLDTVEVTLTDLDANDNKDFKLALTDGTATNPSTLGFDGESSPTYYWVVDNGTVSYQYNVGAGWTVDTDGSISYTGATTKTAFTVEGLKGIKNGTYTSAELPTGITLNNNDTVALTEAVLGDTNIKLTAGDGAGSTTYKLSLGDSVTTIGGTENSAAWFVDSKGVAKYQKTTGAKWTLATGDNSTTITYEAAKEYDTATIYATITGLKSGITADQLNATSTPNAKIIEISDVASATSTSKGTITLHKDVLGTAEVALTSDVYNLALGGDVEGAKSTEYWTGKNGTVVLKQDTAAGYTLDTLSTSDTYNKKVTYTAATTGTTLATIKGINKTLAATGDDSDTPAKVQGITVSGTNILIDDSALTTGNVTLTQGKDKDGKATAYALVYNGEHTKPSDTTATSASWTVTNGTATFKQLTDLYYEAGKVNETKSATNDKITYVAATAPRGALTYATIKGLSKTATSEDVTASTLTTNSDGSYNGTITISADALNKANVTIAEGTVTNSGKKYTNTITLVLDSAAATPTVTSSAWTLNKTTAVMKGTISGGYRLATNGKTITYVKPQTDVNLLTVSGLPKTGCKVVDNVVKVADSDGKYTIDAFTFGTLNSEGTFVPDTTSSTSMGNIVQVNEALLAKTPTKLTVKGTGYEFAPLTSYDVTGSAGIADGNGDYVASEYRSDRIFTSADTIVSGKAASGSTAAGAAGVDVWRVSGTTATYKRVIPAHYELKNGVLTYVKEADAKGSDNKAIVYATITGLAKGLTASADGQQVLNGTDSAIDIASGKIDIKEIALGTATVKFTPGNATGYTLNEEATSYLKTNASGTATNGVWSISGTTATLKAGTTAGWARTTDSKNSSILIFTKQNAKQSGSALVTITGLKSGLKVEDGAINGINVTGTAITLDSKVLPTSGTKDKTTVKFGTNTGNYTLGLASAAEYTPGGTGEVWSVSGTNVTIKSATRSGWTAKDNVITSDGTKETAGDTLVMIKGLKSGLKLNSNGKIDGITIGADGKITLDKSVLGTSNVTVTKEDGKTASTYYYLALNDADNLKSETKADWTISGSTATYKTGVTTAGWAVASGEKPTSITYTKANGGKVEATISGLKSGVATNETIDDYIKLGVDTNTNDRDQTTFYLAGDIFDNKKVTLTNKTSTKYKIAVAQDSTTTVTGLTSDTRTNSAWTVSGTTAILKSAYTEGYLANSTTNPTTLTYYNGLTVDSGSAEIARITNLKKGIRATNGEIAGITESSATEGGTATKTLTLDSRVLTTTNPTLTTTSANVPSGTTYALGLATTANSSDNTYAVTDSTAGFGYSVDNGVVTVTNGYQAKGYSLAMTTSTNDTIKYNKTATAGSTTVATISGLKSGLKAENGQIAGITYTAAESPATGGTFTLSRDVLGTGTVTLTDKDSGANTTYKLALGFTQSTGAGTSTGEWTVKDGAAVYTIKSSVGGYALSNSDTQIDYTVKGTEKVVVGGLGLSGNSVSGLSLSGDTVTVTNNSVGTSVTEVTVSEGYKLALGTAPSKEWKVSGTTASYVQTAGSDGLLCDGNTITKGKQGDTQVLATITGLPENFNGTINETNGVITLHKDATENNTSDIKLTGSGYTLKLDTDNSGSDDAVVPTPLETAAWTIQDVTKKVGKVNVTTATATLAKGTSAGYKLSADGKTATYLPATTTGTATATITGLKAGTKLSTVTSAVKTNNKITLTKDMLGDSDVTVTKGYKLVLDNTSGQEVPTTADAAGTSNTWTLSGTTLTINSTANNYYTASTDGLKVTKSGGTTTQLVKITGLPKGTELNSAGTVDGITLDEVNSTITVSSKLIGDSTGTITIGDNKSAYKFLLADDVSEPTGGDYTWSVSGTTATLKQDISDGYTVDSTGKKITYTAEKVGTKAVTAATITGLKSGLKAENGEIPGISFDGETITVSADALAENAKTPATLNNSSGRSFALALDKDSVSDADDADVINGVDTWSTGGTTATYKQVTPAYYTLDGNKITYTAAKDKATLTTVSNISNFDEEQNFDGDKTVTVYRNNLGGKTVSITGGYSLDLDDQVSGPEATDATWSQKGTTAILTGTFTAGYTQTSDSVVAYTAAQTKQTFASIVGATGTFADDDFVDAENKKVYLYSSDLDENAVTVSGAFLLDFQGYNNASITGSTKSDSIEVDGTGLTISAGAGDDFIDLSGEGGNMIIYGGGKDVIADFKATGTKQDTLKLSSGSITKAEYNDDGDAVLTVGTTGTITLKDFTADSITYLDSNGKAQPKDIASADLLVSDNFLTADSDLSEITGYSALGDVDDTQALSNNNLTTLTKQSSLLTFGTKK